jgi:hypothetical protein
MENLRFPAATHFHLKTFRKPFIKAKLSCNYLAVKNIVKNSVEYRRIHKWLNFSRNLIH